METRGLSVGLPLSITCHLLAQEGALGGNTAICQEKPLDTLSPYMQTGAGLFVTVPRPFIAKPGNKLKSIRRGLGEEMGELGEEIISSR